MSPQPIFHTRALTSLEWQLTPQVPAELEIVRECTIDIDSLNRPEPDIAVVDAEAITGLEQTRVPAPSVRLAIEVVSRESRSG